MKHKIIKLTDGTNLEVNINFATLYYIKDCHVDKLLDKEDELTEDEETELAGKLIYVIMRSNGRKVDMDEAMILTPLDDEGIEDLFTEFSNRVEEYKKKQEARAKMGCLT